LKETVTIRTNTLVSIPKCGGMLFEVNTVKWYIIRS